MVCKFTPWRRLVAMLEWLRELPYRADFPESWQMRDIDREKGGDKSRVNGRRIKESGCFGKPRPIEGSNVVQGVDDPWANRHNIGMNLLSLLFREPWVFVAFVAVFVISLSVHECAHALASFWLGDTTAERQGRLTLNPAAHIDPMGFIALLLLGFGWGKPVPFNPYQLRLPRIGPVLVAAAGPVSNVLMGILFTFLAVWVEPRLGSSNLLTIFATAGAFLNFSLAIFNLIPVPPLDGSKALLAILDEYRFQDAYRWVATQGPNLLLILVLADMVLPIGPLSWIARASGQLVEFFASFMV